MSLNNKNNADLPTGSTQQIQQTPNSTDIFNSLRIPDAIKDLPKYDGNPRLLHEFITNVEEILLHIRGADNTPQGLIFLRAIRNKIDGQANEVLNTYGTSLNWNEIKSNLITHYSDKRTETSLIRDLHSLRQYGKPVEKFYSEVMEIQSILTTNVSIHETDLNVIIAKRDLFTKMCLNSFLTGLREPLGSTVRAMRPESLAVALDYCIREQNIYYSRTDTYKPKFSKFKPYSRHEAYSKPYNYNSQNYNNNNTNGQYDIRNNISQTNWRQQQPTREEYRNNNTTQRTYNSGRQINWRQSQSPAEPMDTSSGYSNYNTNSGRFKSSPSTQYSKRSNQNELNNINEFRNPNYECQNHIRETKREEYTNLDQFENHDINDEQNFRVLASSDKQGI